MSFSTLKMVPNSVRIWYGKNCTSGKNLGLQLWPKIFSTSQIAAFFSHQYPWKELIDIFYFSEQDDQQGKVAS